MERVCGLLGPKVMSRSQVNRNLSLAILKGQQLHYIPLYLGNPFQIDGDDSESDSDSDSDSDADDSTDSEADTNTSNKYVNYSVIIVQLQVTKGHTTSTSNQEVVVCLLKVRLLLSITPNQIESSHGKERSLKGISRGPKGLIPR